ncbi:alcohol dehydrogenase catalytic domain-containing protein [Saccharopolyspora phatthalungensis]|uniref:alcohol dehydrogenase n=1 Tax=Saccharopolyspora phatthalungensis TaxID=664693 RepID=A0A840QJC5_9PSEU|nr:zinc-binding dehydrogenase [Saccharopolyspora phatthalungensis]MBB5158965.1 D-arabinose 1-dehydrogenase-like Zn-dependent alcohol dehydrogenase [Saccharopolyspora phatthalungensis]
MRAVVVGAPGGPEVARVCEVERPSPAPDQVLVRVAACGMCGHDQADRMGLTKAPLPGILGHEIAGTVAEIGSAVRHLKVGDRVAAKQFTHCGRCPDCYAGRDVDCVARTFTYGGYAEFVALPESSLLTVPAHVGLDSAAVVACTVGTCLQALRGIGRVVPGETVVVTGAGGGLGLHGVQVAKALGATVIAVTGSAAKADALTGADHVVDTGQDWWPRLLELTDGRGAEVVLDNVGHPAVFRQAFRGLAKRGRYVFTGQVSGDPVRLHPAFLFHKEAVLTGSASTTMSSFADALAMVADGRVTPVVTTYPLAEATQAFADLDARRVAGRIVLTTG